MTVKSLFRNYFIFLFCFCSMMTSAGAAPEHDLSTEKVLYAVGTAHLDTQWRWTIQTTIDEYIKNTLDDNFALFEDYPDYNFSFEGAFRYMLMKEYYPDRYETMADYIEQGRWHVAGSTVENGDMNVVSPESLIRQALIGNNFFENEFNQRSTDIYLPDCFGFSYTMPTWGAHCGINGFSSQKLSWGGAVDTPFNVGVWQGPDGSSIVAALNPGSYVSELDSDLSSDSDWLDRINETGDNYGVYGDYMYFGTGDTGGAPSEDSCQWLETSMAGSGDITVVSAGSDDLYNDITAEQKASLPVYDGELLMRIHGTGCYTSQAAMKRWNRQNELLADAAERVSFMADWLGGIDYPQATIDAAWTRFLWHTHHDDITGTSIPEAYHFSWNDEILSLNQFASILGSGAASICQGLDTQVSGVPVVVYNPLAFSREDVVEATVSYETEVPDCVQVFDGSREVASQILSRQDDSITIAFVASVGSVGFKVFDVRSSEQACALETGLSVSSNTLENASYQVTINENGDIASIWDKENERELLDEPCRLQLLSDTSTTWPAWEIRYEDLQTMPYDYVDDAVTVTIAEDGPARVALQVVRTYGTDDVSTFVQTLSLSSEDDSFLTVANEIDWRTTGTLLKASFPLSAVNSIATYDLGMGTIQRSNNQYDLYEVPAQQWADLTDSSGDFGVSILNDCRYGWDKPTNNMLRLTLLHTPAVDSSYTDQSTQDLGQHKLSYAIAPHAEDWTAAQTPRQAARLNQPLTAFQTEAHDGFLGSDYSFLQVDNAAIFVKAIKKAQRSDELIVRFQELYGSSASGVRVAVGEGIESAREVDGCEQDVASATVVDGELEFDLTKYQPRTFALTLADPESTVDAVASSPLTLSYNMDAFSWDEDRSDGDFDDGMTYPAELMDETLECGGILFEMGPLTDGENNALACKGNAVYLGSHEDTSLYLLAASRNGDTDAVFKVAGESVTVAVQDYHDNVVDWGREDDTPYLKRDTVAWVGTHRHEADGNMAYEFCNLYLYRIDLPAGASSIILPDNEDVVIFAMTIADSPADETSAVTEIYDSLPYLPDLVPTAETRTNLALNKTVTADGYISGENPELAVDGTTEDNSKWCVSGDSDDVHWLMVDLGQFYDVDTFVVRHAGDGGEGTSWNTSDYCIQSSPDGSSNWTDLVSVEGNTASVTRHTVEVTSVRFVRLYITDPTQNANTAVRIYEFEVYGPCDGSFLEGDVSGPEGVADCQVNLYDLLKVAEDWAVCNEPLWEDCQSYWLEIYPDETSGSDLSDDDTSAELPDDALVAYWKFQEGSGQTLHDLTDVDDAGTLAGDTLPEWVTGWCSQDTANYALYFDGTGYVSVQPDQTAASPNLYELQDAITISAWFNADDWEGNRRIVQKGNSDNQYRLLVENDALVFHVYEVGEITADLPSTGVWHHAVGIYDGQSMQLYLDGVLQQKIYASGTINITDDPLYIGTKTAGSSSGDHFKGTLDEIRIYNVGLTQQQVRQLTQLGDNTPPVIAEITRRDDLAASAIGQTPLSADVYDANGDTLSYQWAEADGSTAVSFEEASGEETTAVFAESGEYTIQLTVSDGSESVTDSTVVTIAAMDCATVRELDHAIGGDINNDCHVDIEDLLVLSDHWLMTIDGD